MPHMVIYRTPDGKPGYHQTEELEDAVRHVEGLRNDGHVTETRIFRMEEVPIEIKTYYRVEIHAGAPAEAAAAPAPAPAPVGEAAVAPQPQAAQAQEPAVVSAQNGAGSGRFGLFGKS